jgi:hypothetical protein
MEVVDLFVVEGTASLSDRWCARTLRDSQRRRPQKHYRNDADDVTEPSFDWEGNKPFRVIYSKGVREIWIRGDEIRTGLTTDLPTLHFVIINTHASSYLYI